MNWKAAKNIDDPDSKEGRIFNGIEKLLSVRRDHIVFDSLADTWIVETYNDHILGIGRYYQGEKLIALFNFGDQDETAWIDEPEQYYDLMSGKKRPAKNVLIPSGDFAWLFHKFD